MTVASETSRIEYVGDGTSDEFAVPFYFIESAHLVVYNGSALVTENVHYTVTGAGNPAGGTVTFGTAPANGNSVVILRDPPVTQTTDYEPNDPFPAESHEAALDKLTMIAQRLSSRVDRSLHLADDETLVADTELPAPQSEALIGWNTAATALVNRTFVAGSATVDLPAGLIAMWSGSIGAIPARWALCDGTTGTPDLRDRFIVGAGSAYSVDGTGGTTSATTSSAGAHSHTVTVDAHALTVDEMPLHGHPWRDNTAGSGGGVQAATSGPYFKGEGLTGTNRSAYSGTPSDTAGQTIGGTGGGLGHSHTASSASTGAHTHTVDPRPPYYALAFIMYLGPA